MAWCLKLPLDVQQNINYMRFEGTPSARAIKAFEINGNPTSKFRVVAKDPGDYILIPNKNGGQWRNGEWREAPMTTKRRYAFITHSRMRHLGRKTDPYPRKVTAEQLASMRAMEERSVQARLALGWGLG